MTKPATFGGSDYPSTTAIEALADLSRDFPAAADRIDAILRAVPSPDTVGVREATIEECAKAVESCCGSQSMIAAHLRSLALSHSHCTAGRREEIARKLCELDGYTWNLISDKPYYFTRADAIFALTSEQSGPTAGSEERTYEETKQVYRDLLKAFPPDRQRDQDETSVLARGASAEAVAWRVRNDHGHWHATTNRALAETWRDIEKLNVEPLYASPPVLDASREALEHIRELFEKAPHLREADGSLPGAHPVTWIDLASLDVEQ